MPKQLGPLPSSEFPDKSLEIALKGYLRTLEKDQELLQDYRNVTESSIDFIISDLHDLYEFLGNSRSAQAILPYRLRLLDSLQQAIEGVMTSELLLREATSIQKLDQKFFSSLQRARQSIKSVQATLITGLSKPLYSRTPYRRR
jgi:hypothetical protein